MKRLRYWPSSHVSGCMRNSAFAVFSCLRLYEEQRIRHLLLSQAVWGTAHSPSSHVSGCMRNSAFAIVEYSKTWKTACRHISSVTSAPFPVYQDVRIFGVSFEMFRCQLKFNPSTLRKQTFQLADNVADVRARHVLRISLNVGLETVSSHLHVQRSRHVCRHRRLCAALAHRALTSVGTTTWTQGQLSKTAPSNSTTSTRRLNSTYQHTKLLILIVNDADLYV